MSFATIPELIAEIRAGRMVVVVDDEDRENEGDLIMAAECVRPEDINFMAREARGLICLGLTAERCRQLELPPMVVDNRSPHRTAFTVSIEAAEGVTTGISAFDRAHTIRTAVRAGAGPRDLTQPGHIFPLAAQAGGVLSRAGHTEASVDLAALAGLTPAGVLVEVMSDDGTMARRPELEAFAAKHGLKIGSIADLIRHRLAHERTVLRVDDRAVDTDHGPFRLLSYRSAHDPALHFALVRGEVGDGAPVMARVHLANMLTDVLHLKRADLGMSVERALAAIDRAGRGVVVVLDREEAAGSELARLTGAAPAATGSGDWRSIGLGAQILADLGVTRIQVLGTPRRFLGLSGFGIEVLDYVSADET